MTIEYVSNCHLRPFLYGYELTPAELARFDWLDSPEHSDGFIRYRGWVYHLNEFVYVRSVWGSGVTFDNAPFEVHASNSDTFFSTIVLHVTEDCEEYKIGMAFAKEDFR